MAVVVTEVEPSRTFRLRQEVLRPHESVEQMSLFDDDHPDTGIFAAVETDTGKVVGTGNVRRELPPAPLATALSAGPGVGQQWRLRGMATREDLRGQGIGRGSLLPAPPTWRPEEAASCGATPGWERGSFTGERVSLSSGRSSTKARSALTS